MNDAFTKLTTIGSVLSLTLVAACGGSGAPEQDDSPEAEAFRYRDSIMELAAYKATRVGGMARGEMPLDEDVFVESTRDLANIAAMTIDGFMPESAVGDSRALPEIWSDWEDFERRAQEYENATAMLAETAEQEGFEAARGLVQDTLGSCGDCHRTYRASEDDE